VTPAHRAPKRLTRRRVLGAAALAAIPVATVVLQQARSRQPSAEATTNPVTGGKTPVAGTPSATAGSPSTGPKVVTSGGGVVPYRPGRVMLGAYLDLQGKSAQQAQALRRQQLGRDQRIVHQFYGWTDTLPRSIPYLPRNAFPMISWRGCEYADILDGSSDDLIARAARNLRKLGRPTLLRWAWEMNGNWYEWGGANNNQSPGDFVKCWQRLHRIFAEQGADNVSWVFSVNWNSRPDVSWNQYADYYPGDRYVDWVGSDGYNLHRESPDTLFRPIYDEFATRKPIMISEVGSFDRGGSTKGDWITLFADWVAQHPAVGAVAWFDTDTHASYDERWRIDTDPRSLAAYKAMAQNPRFAG
jgi:hypothetical protein